MRAGVTGRPFGDRRLQGSRFLNGSCPGPDQWGSSQWSETGTSSNTVSYRSGVGVSRRRDLGQDRTLLTESVTTRTPGSDTRLRREVASPVRTPTGPEGPGRRRTWTGTRLVDKRGTPMDPETLGATTSSTTHRVLVVVWSTVGGGVWSPTSRSVGLAVLGWRQCHCRPGT